VEEVRGGLLILAGSLAEDIEMSESLKACFAFIGIVCGLILLATIAFSEAWERQHLWFPLLLIAGMVLSIGAVVAVLRRKDEVPDFLHTVAGRYFDQNGFCFAVIPEIRNSILRLRVFVQNRYERDMEARLVIRPPMGFVRRSGMRPLGFEGHFGPGYFGVVTIPCAVPAEMGDKVMRCEVGAEVRYPNGRGRELRHRAGLRVASTSGLRNTSRIGAWIDVLVMLVTHSRRSSFTFRMPPGAAPDCPDSAPQFEKLWVLGEPLP
jgi:hypothetical protein